MRELITLIIIITLCFFGYKHDKRTPNKYKIKQRANVLYLDSLESAYIFKTKALRIYMPIAINNNAKK